LAEIKDALVKLLPDVKKVKDISLYGPAAPGGTKGQKQGVQILTPYGEVPLSALSLGYQTMTAWTVDLAWRLYQHFPKAPEPMRQPAIVLIDELDLHLHPRWQRSLRTNISEIFPKVQFIATAHSPLLAQSYLEMNLVVVREQNGHAIIESDPQTVKTWRIDEVVTSSLYEVDSAFSPDVGRDLRERTELIQTSHLTAAQKRRLQQLNELADSVTPKYDADTEEALKFIRSASKLIDADKK
jgi:predicted ATP-binding protein involved in virulence